MKGRVHHAGWVMVEPATWIENGIVEVADGRVAATGRGTVGTGAVDHGPGVIMPALGNAHTHLSLSCLKGRIDLSQGFISWVRDLIRLREVTPGTETDSAAMAAAAAMKASGVGFAAEVGPLEPGAGAMHENRIAGAVFLECLGHRSDCPPLPDNVGGLFFSWAGHAPHTTAPELLAELKAATNRAGKPFSIHLAESEAEVEFLSTGKGEWLRFMEGRGIDCSHWGPWGQRPVERAYRLGLLDPRTIAVHLLEVQPHEMDILARTGARVCVCPRSNLALHGKLPPIEALMERGLNPAIGTDSLASVPGLSIFDEMRFIALHYPNLRPETIMGFATTNAALAMGTPELGSLKPGRPARMIYVDLEAGTGSMAAEKLVSEKGLEVRWL
ncbi:MAG: amidohydrolase family protein [Deltaproteobacteria bacterium]|nr:amidohydrolase family protein [Deltaproteobacteria bacterium]MBW2048124.1 amidohydrolase family protein [Deltaproteobacteria bacterium]MBW2110865.1 amidohydrolase family protein [Deltaproteobacteria bacterium]MBW2353901.1 amidohydrolase family protein [Deltaproteobacteria bacterium]